MTRSGFAFRSLQNKFAITDFMRRRNKSNQVGFTLLEVLLVLSLTVVLLGLLSMSISLNLRATALGRSEIMEAQLARTLLQRIGVDLRSAISNSQLRQSTSNTSTSSMGSSSGSLANGSTGSGSSSGSSDASTDSTSSESLVTPPGLYGGLDWIEVDRGRIPRPDQILDWQAVGGTYTGQQPLGDTITVSYYLGGSQYDSLFRGQASQSGGNVQSSMGLFRAEQSRAAKDWALEQGTTAQVPRQVILLAEEITALKFLYFDGYEWFDTWDSQLQSGLPMAVDIELALSTQDSRGDLARGSGASTPQINTYHLVVTIPLATPTGTSTETTTTSDSSSSSNSNGTSGSGASQ